MLPSVIAETEAFIVLDKPAGLICHSDGRTEEPSLVGWLCEQFPYLSDVGEPWVSPQGESVPIAGLVHRLDRPTSGVILVAKTNEEWRFLKNEFKERRVEKVYRAFAYGLLPVDSGTIVAEIMRSGVLPKRWYARPCDVSDNRAAITDWKVIGRVHEGEPATYVEIYPKTGRTHQIRVHFATIGHPIVADHLYAVDMQPILGFTRPALHAYSISFADKRGERVKCMAPVPTDFVSAEHLL
jgi:23S rRNA pseudouridine1911/1915/1917 synthase